MIGDDDDDDDDYDDDRDDNEEFRKTFKKTSSSNQKLGKGRKVDEKNPFSFQFSAAISPSAKNGRSSILFLILILYYSDTVSHTNTILFLC